MCFDPSPPGADQVDQALHPHPDQVHLWRAQHRECGRGVPTRLLHPRHHHQRQDRPGGKLERGKYKFSKCENTILQVSGVLELDQSSEGSARYLALDKWNNQLNNLQKLVVNKMA